MTEAEVVDFSNRIYKQLCNKQSLFITLDKLELIVDIDLIIEIVTDELPEAQE